MEQIDKIIMLSIIMYFCMTARANNIMPVDAANLELMIEAHKVMAKAEDAAVLELTALEGSQAATNTFSSKYNKTRSQLNQRMADVNSYLTLAAGILNIGIKLKDLIEDYADFTKTTIDNTSSHPFLAIYFASINTQLGMEIQLLYKRCAFFELCHTNVLKATMKEKFQILNFISIEIAHLSRLVSGARLRCKSISVYGVKGCHIIDFINNKSNREIMKKVIEKWNTKAKQQDNG